MKRLIFTAAAVATALAAAAPASANVPVHCRVDRPTAQATEYEATQLTAFNMPAKVIVAPGLRKPRCSVANQIALEAWNDAGRSGRPYDIGPTNSRDSFWRFHWQVSSNAPASQVAFSAHVVATHGRYKVTLDLNQQYSNDNAPWKHCDGGANDC